MALIEIYAKGGERRMKSQCESL